MGNELRFVCREIPGAGDECVFVECEDASGNSVKAGEWRPRADGLAELVVKMPAEQGQGEPLGWVRPEAMEAFRDVGWVHVFAAKGGDDSAVAVYTHTDPGEIERLRAELGEVKGEYDRAANKVEELRGIIRGLEQNVLTHSQLSAQMRAQNSALNALCDERFEELAKRDALLRDISKVLDSWRSTDELEEIGDRAAALISASAETSAPVERSGLKECPKGYGHGGQWCGPSYNCWLDRRSDEEKARAALELKPPTTPRDAFAAWEPTGNPIRGVNGRLAAKAGFDAGWCAGWTECRADMERKPS